MKTQNGYTNGPWSVVVEFNDSNNPAENFCSIRSVDGTFVAEVCNDVDHKREVITEQANARLIAAAPELLEACEDALRVLEAMGHKNTVCAIDLRTVIAKARKP